MMRYLICLAIGLIVGVLTADMVGNATARRHAWPRGLMNVMQHELGEARAGVRGGTCAAARVTSASAHLQLLTGDLENALLAPPTKDRVLSQYADEMRSAVAQWDPHATCTQQSEALTTIANACKACHRDYR